MTANNTRIAWLDISKAITIFLIVLGHVSFDSTLNAFLWTFHVPFFFFISGYLFKSGDTTKNFLNRRVTRILLPYVYLYLISTLILLILQGFEIDRAIAILVGIVYGTHSYPAFANAPLWFLPSLFIAELIFFFLIRKNYLFLLPFLGLSIYLYYKGYINLFLSIDLTLLGINFYFAGNLFKQLNLFTFQSGKKVPVIVACIIGALLLTDFALKGNVWYGGSNYGMSFLGGIAGIVFVCCLGFLIEKLVKDNIVIKFLSANTLLIFGLHGFSNIYAFQLINYWNYKFDYPILTYLTTAVLSILFLVPFIIVINRYLPQINGQKGNILKQADSK